MKDQTSMFFYVTKFFSKNDLKNDLDWNGLISKLK